MTMWLLIVDTSNGPMPFALFWAEWACLFVLDGLSGVVAQCLPRVAGVAL